MPRAQKRKATTTTTKPKRTFVDIPADWGTLTPEEQDTVARENATDSAPAGRVLTSKTD